MTEPSPQCTQCGSSDLTPGAKSSFDGAITYRCSSCGAVQRPVRRRSTVILALLLGSVIGLGGSALFIGTITRAIDWGKSSPPIGLFVGFMALGLSCAVWAVVQLVRKR